MPLSPGRIQIIPPKAMYFDGVDDYVTVPDSPSLRLTTLTAIVMVKVWSYDAWNVIISKATSEANKPNYEFSVHRIYGNLCVWNGSASACSRYVATLNTWLHVAYVVNGGVSFYVSGSFIDSYSWSVNTAWDSNPLFIGVDYPSPRNGDYNFARIYLAQVLLYSRALSRDEILWNYNYPDNPVRDGLVLWLHWDSIDVNARKWYDKSGFGNHGTIYGATLVQLQLPPRRKLSPFRVQSPVR